MLPFDLSRGRPLQSNLLIILLLMIMLLMIMLVVMCIFRRLSCPGLLDGLKDIVFTNRDALNLLDFRTFNENDDSGNNGNHAADGYEKARCP